MKKFLFHSGVLCATPKLRLLLMFKWVFIFVFAFCLRVSAVGYSQDTPISLDIRNMEFKKVLAILQRKGKIHLLYSNELLPQDKAVNLVARDELVLEVLQKLLLNTGLTYKVLNEELVVIAPEGSELKNTGITGRILDEQGRPLA